MNVFKHNFVTFNSVLWQNCVFVTGLLIIWEEGWLSRKNNWGRIWAIAGLSSLSYPAFFPCANCPSCEQGQLPAAFGGVEKKDTLAGTRCSSEPGVERGRKPIFFSQLCCRKCQAALPKPGRVVGACICKGTRPTWCCCTEVLRHLFRKCCGGGKRNPGVLGWVANSLEWIEVIWLRVGLVCGVLEVGEEQKWAFSGSWSRQTEEDVQDQDLVWTFFWDDVALGNHARLWEVFQELEAGGSWWCDE